ncbi:MAG TPA: pseudouridine synthase [Anaerolineaceae bacterium]|nr:pseudouridine synthase [Anaerolineaceae bacterium]HOD44042.1 pseudouridine synthase [Anaerolineaceae bacterium]HOH18764.1 pseudouridine synthase [Anaerolineaceae bacterium]HQO96481.1 pseudouridine synthase [Anaerolineaceae bacterium]
MEERLQKILARNGFGSRRSSETIILEGRVRVNGVVAKIGAKADPFRDTITVDGKPLPKTETRMVYVALHKPRYVLSDSGAIDDRKTVRDLVPLPGHLFTVGRLDFDSEGLILLTNDGELANILTHPRYGHEKEYRVLVSEKPDEKQLSALRHGVVLEDGHRTAPAHVKMESAAGKSVWIRMTLREGRNRQIREMAVRVGLDVIRLVRVRIGSVLLGNLKPGEWRELSNVEVRRLKVITNVGQKANLPGGRKSA